MEVLVDQEDLVVEEDLQVNQEVLVIVHLYPLHKVTMVEQEMELVVVEVVELVVLVVMTMPFQELQTLVAEVVDLLEDQEVAHLLPLQEQVVQVSWLRERLQVQE